MNKQLEKQADEAKRVSLWSIMVADREKSIKEIFYQYTLLLNKIVGI